MKQQPLKCVTKDTTLGQCLEYVHNIEGNLQSVKLSKYVEKAQQLTRGGLDLNVTPARQNSGGCDDEKPKCDK